MEGQVEWNSDKMDKSVKIILNVFRVLAATVIISFFSISCANTEDKGQNEMTFGDLVDLGKLEKVRMRNNSGTFDLTSNQVDKIRLDLASMVYDPNMSVKVGAINIELTIDGKVYDISTATHGDYMEVHNEIISKNKDKIENAAWLYFRTVGVNFDNYKEEGL